jgi:F-type H+-transporting ATPase subunit c
VVPDRDTEIKERIIKVMRKFGALLLWTLVAMALPAVAFAAGDGGVNFGPGIGAGLAVGLAGLGCGIGQGLTAGNTTAGIARNPGAAGAMFTNFILGMVLIESIAIYGLVISFMLL